MKFIKNDKCIICKSNYYTSKIYHCNFLNKKLRKFIKDYYLNININILKNYIYSIRYCKKCEFYWQEYIPDNELTYELYEKWINPRLSKEKSLSNQLKFRKQVKSILSTVLISFHKSYSELRFLDYGAGWGGWSLLAKEMGIDTYSLEISPERIKHLEERGIKTIPRLTPIIKYDLILLNQVLEHVSGIDDLLILLNQSLSNNGYLIISVPDCRKIRSKIKQNKFFIGKNQLHPIEHINGFTNYSLEKLMNKFNFKKISLIHGIKINICKIDLYILRRTLSFIYNHLFSTTLIFKKSKWID
jgi:hypothetical protein